MSIRRLINDLPIQKKLWIFNLVTALVSGLVASALLIAVIWKVEMAASQRNLEIQAAILAENVLPSVQFNDLKTGGEIITGFGRDKNIMEARVIDVRGVPFAEYRVPTWGVAAEAATPTITVHRTIELNGERIGAVTLTKDSSEVVEQLVTYIGAVGLATLVALVVGSFVVVRLQRAITDPLAELNRLMSVVSRGGDLSQRASQPSRDELGQLSASFNLMIEQLEQRSAQVGKELAERLHAEKQLEHLAHHDPVTGLPNRHLFRKLTEQLVRGNALESNSIALLFVDLDNFKYVNDTFGHDTGDQLLLAVAERLTAQVRAHDLVVRFGGDEFVLLLDRIGSREDALRSASKVLAAIMHPLDLGDREFTVTCSIGVALAPEHAGNFDELLQKADSAMYAAKTSGKNAVRLWEEQLSDDSSRRFTLEADLRHAMLRGEIEMHYQPIVELANGRVAGVEALMRWRHPSRGFVSPAEFIPLAEETGLIIELGDWAMRTAFAQGGTWNRRFGPLFVAVNVSGRQFRDHGFAARAQACAVDCGMPIHLAEIELTESVVMGHTCEAVRLLEDLSDRGFSLSIDDFGTGYSSLSYLKRFPIDKLKIDPSFVQDLPEDASDKAIAEAIIGLARTLSLRVVAEGIETGAQADLLCRLGTPYGQGYFFSKPLPVELATSFIAENLASTHQPAGHEYS